MESNSKPYGLVKKRTDFELVALKPFTSVIPCPHCYAGSLVTEMVNEKGIIYYCFLCSRRYLATDGRGKIKLEKLKCFQTSSKC